MPFLPLVPDETGAEVEVDADVLYGIVSKQPQTRSISPTWPQLMFADRLERW